MDSSRSPAASASAAHSFKPADLWLSLLTPPLLLGIVGIRSLADALQQVGLASEELFRGDRLPSLTIPAPSTKD
ncbi:MAG: hypothetical protein ICV62_01715 [Cyanobacteria bacterium Co-bin13]|nr:hypothetical protein [Cyanobacteria bacterium Co-bin13]